MLLCYNAMMHVPYNYAIFHDVPYYRRNYYKHGKTHALLQHSFNSTGIRSVQDNVATPVTAMMVTVCISTDALSSVFIIPNLSDTNMQINYRLQQSVPNIPVPFCYIRLIQL